MTTPRVFVVRHGETEWSLNGRHTSISDIPLTANGEKRVLATGRALVGDDRLIIPGKLVHIFVSPRARAKRTLELLSLGCSSGFPWSPVGQCHYEGSPRTNAEIEVTEDIREWDYGDYEGITSHQIQKERRERGEPRWDIWRDGCPGGESPEDVTVRLTKLIQRIRTEFHAPCIGKPKGSSYGDVVIIAHGHILRAFAMLWAGKTLQDGPTFLLEAGGVGTLSYEHHNIDEPAILLGGSFMSDIAETHAGSTTEGKEEVTESK